MTPLHIRDMIQSVKAGRRIQYAERLRKRLEKYQKLIAMFATYDVTIFGEKLGLTVDTPCLFSEAPGRFRPFQERAKFLASTINLKQTTKTAPIVVIHRCDNRQCINGEHIIYGTVSDNTRDALLKGRYPGRKCGDVVARREAMTAECTRLAAAIALLTSPEPAELVIPRLEIL